MELANEILEDEPNAPILSGALQCTDTNGTRYRADVRTGLVRAQ